MLLWTVKSDNYKLFQANGVLFRLGEPDSVEFWSRGREATHQELYDSIESGIGILEQEAEKQIGATAELNKLKMAFNNKIIAHYGEAMYPLIRHVKAA